MLYLTIFLSNLLFEMLNHKTCKLIYRIQYSDSISYMLEKFIEFNIQIQYPIS